MLECESALCPSAVTTDEAGGVDINSAARGLGLKPVRAWVPDGTKNNRNANAARTKRSREKAEAQGLRQLSITLPAALHPMLRTLAARTKAGESVENVVADLIDKRAPQHGDQAPAAQTAGAGAATPTIRNLPAWRRALIWWLLTPDLRRTLDR